MALYLDNTEQAGELFFVEIIISPHPVIGNCKPFSDVISVTQALSSELASTSTVCTSSSQPVQQMCSVTVDNYNKNTGTKRNMYFSICLYVCMHSCSCSSTRDCHNWSHSSYLVCYISFGHIILLFIALSCHSI